MSDLINDENEQVDAEAAAKRKRMATAVKAVGGWFSYFMGWATLAIGTLNILEIYNYFDPLLTLFGLVIAIGGLYLLHWHIKDKNLSGKPRFVKLVKYVGGILIIPGFLGIMSLPNHSTFYIFFALFFIAGLIILVISSVLKKVWGIKPEKRKRVIQEE